MSLLIVAVAVAVLASRGSRKAAQVRAEPARVIRPAVLIAVLFVLAALARR